MGLFDKFVVKIKQSESPFYRTLYRIGRNVASPTGLRAPKFLRPLFRRMYSLHYSIPFAIRTVITMFYLHPIFSARCASVGRNVHIDRLPYISGDVDVVVGNNVWIGGKVCVFSTRQENRARLIIKDNALINWNTYITVNSEVIIEEHVLISYDCRIADSDGHRLEPDLRAQQVPVDASQIRPIRICRNAWIGNGAHIMKGVTIGEGAIVAANSVVTRDVPPYSLARGNPAQIVAHKYEKYAPVPMLEDAVESVRS